jgi:hypothetical protein
MDGTADAGARLVSALEGLDEVAREMTPDEAADALAGADLQLFWREWPHASKWAGALWRKVNEDLAGPATQQQDAELDEVGGSE